MIYDSAISLNNDYRKVHPYFLGYREALEKVKKSKLELPPPDIDGRIPTLNNKGAMAPKVDRIAEAFLADIKGKHVLEIGSAFGNVLL